MARLTKTSVACMVKNDGKYSRMIANNRYYVKIILQKLHWLPVKQYQDYNNIMAVHL